MAHTSKDPKVHRKPDFDSRREDAWKQAPSREVTNDRGTNVEVDPEHRRHETSKGNPDDGPPGGGPHGSND
jgi:hypothetical protein